MAFGDIMKGVGKAAANAFLDEFSSTSKKLGKSDGPHMDELKSFVNGEVDWNGNPIEDDDDE